ncbi:MAG: MoxR family ATPase [Proteobacteria bacterium]|nr:MoxR family ATPase [Pseudomonadota bacterium]
MQNSESTKIVESAAHSAVFREQVEHESKALKVVLAEMSKVIVGQEHMTRSLLLGLLTEGHVLLEGLPGLAKTLAVKSLAAAMDAKFQRIQFTPDLLPSDLIGTIIYRQDTHDFVPKKGPLFSNLILADEINRAPAKVQSALLEAMAEKQVTIGDSTYPLQEPFLVLATQNPIEQEGTYTLPEAQLDRFMFKLKVGYPTREEEKRIMERMASLKLPHVQKVISTEDILRMRTRLELVYSDKRIEEYILRLVLATRSDTVLDSQEADLTKLKDLRQSIRIGASPRATLFLHRASRANAFLEGRTFVTPDDIKAVAPEILRHRLILTFDAEARGLGSDRVIGQLLETVTVP